METNDAPYPRLAVGVRRVSFAPQACRVWFKRPVSYRRESDSTRRLRRRDQTALVDAASQLALSIRPSPSPEKAGATPAMPPPPPLGGRVAECVPKFSYISWLGQYEAMGRQTARNHFHRVKFGTGDRFGKLAFTQPHTAPTFGLSATSRP